MGKLYNFWTEDEAIDSFFHLYPETTYENLIKHLEENAPWLTKHKDRIWFEINL